jgi:hypothetical protein
MIPQLVHRIICATTAKDFPAKVDFVEQLGGFI